RLLSRLRRRPVKTGLPAVVLPAVERAAGLDQYDRIMDLHRIPVGRVLAAPVEAALVADGLVLGVAHGKAVLGARLTPVNGLAVLLPHAAQLKRPRALGSRNAIDILALAVLAL